MATAFHFSNPIKDRGSSPRRSGNGALARRPVSSEQLLYDLLGASVVLAEDWDRLSPEERARMLERDDPEGMIDDLLDVGVLTSYQASRIKSGSMFGLVLSNFRILERLGVGGMAVVYKAEHIEMRHLVALKVLHLARNDDPRLEMRFTAEMRTIARLRHPNIVWAMDAGRAYSPDPDGPVLWYLVMEYVPGEDLEAYVRGRGPLAVPQACNLIHQIASALDETNKLHLVHRDIKPSNILVTPEEQAKLLDFGLSRHVPTKLTQPGTVMGTVDYMAPEQAKDSSTVDIRADIYSLGGTLYWCLTGELPFPDQGNELEMLLKRLTQEPPSLRAVLPDVPPGLDALVRKMMARDPNERFATPQEVMHALIPYLRPGSAFDLPRLSPQHLKPEKQVAAVGKRAHQVLVIDDEPSIRRLCRELLQSERVNCSEAASGEEGLELAKQRQPDLILLDVHMKGMSGPETLARLRTEPPAPNMKIIMCSGAASSDDLAGMLLVGADDYLVKPFSIPQLLCKAQAALRLKEAQDRSDYLNRQLLATNADLESTLTARDSALVEVRTALVLGLARLVGLRENDTGKHLLRMQRYCRCLAEEAAKAPSFAGQIDRAFIEMIACCAPLHDIGKVGLPDEILLKPGKLTPDELQLMQAHTTLPAETLAELSQEYGAARGFLQMAGDIVRHHHERYDGTGYPDHLVGAAIPLPARMVAITDTYDALRCRRLWKPALGHLATTQLIVEGSGTQFDPAIVEIFRRCAPRIEQIFKEVPG